MVARRALGSEKRTVRSRRVNCAAFSGTGTSEASGVRGVCLNITRIPDENDGSQPTNTRICISPSRLNSSDNTHPRSAAITTLASPIVMCVVVEMLPTGVDLRK